MLRSDLLDVARALALLPGDDAGDRLHQRQSHPPGAWEACRVREQELYGVVWPLCPWPGPPPARHGPGRSSRSRGGPGARRRNVPAERGVVTVKRSWRTPDPDRLALLDGPSEAPASPPEPSAAPGQAGDPMEFHRRLHGYTVAQWAVLRERSRRRAGTGEAEP